MKIFAILVLVASGFPRCQTCLPWWSATIGRPPAVPVYEPTCAVDKLVVGAPLEASCSVRSAPFHDATVELLLGNHTTRTASSTISTSVQSTNGTLVKMPEEADLGTNMTCVARVGSSVRYCSVPVESAVIVAGPVCSQTTTMVVGSRTALSCEASFYRDAATDNTVPIIFWAGANSSNETETMRTETDNIDFGSIRNTTYVVTTAWTAIASDNAQTVNCMFCRMGKNTTKSSLFWENAYTQKWECSSCWTRIVTPTLMTEPLCSVTPLVPGQNVTFKCEVSVYRDTNRELYDGEIRWSRGPFDTYRTTTTYTANTILNTTKTGIARWIGMDSDVGTTVQCVARLGWSNVPKVCTAVIVMDANT